MNVCIVGFGAIGPVHAEALAQIEAVSIYGICDCDREKANKGAARYGAKAFYDFSDCINDRNIDVVHICTPHYLHFEMITKALDSGKLVVVEKPAVMKSSELDTLMASYDVSKVFPIVQNRTNVCVQRLRELIVSNYLGRLKGIKGILTWNRNADYYNSAAWRGTKKYEGGGVLINQAVHTLDLMIYFAGEAESISASMQNHSLTDIIEVEDTVNAYIRFRNRAVGIFYATNAYSENSDIQLELDFENAKAAYVYGRLYINGEMVCSDDKSFSGKKYWGNGHLSILQNLYANNSSFCLADIKNTMDAMFAMYESAEKGCPVILQK